MQEALSKRIQNMSESQTIAMSRRSRELQAKGIDVINLSLGEPDFPTPDFIKEAAVQAMKDNYTKYPPVPGYLDLREAISQKFMRDNGLDYPADQIVVSTGAKQSIINVVLSLINPGDEVIVPAPFWVSYVEMIRMAQGVPVMVSAGIESDFKITPEQLEGALTTKSKLMIFSSPCNPTGSVYTKDELAAIAQVIEKQPNFYVICDEIYEHINFSGPHASLASNASIKDRVVTINGVSKGFSMTGWRIGYIGAPKWIAAACTKIQGQFTSGANSIAQRAAKAAVEADPKVTTEMKAAFLRRRDLVLNRLKKIEGISVNEPQGAFYVFPDISSFFGKSAEGTTIANATDLSMYLLDKANVALVTGEAFGSPNCLRISYAAADEVLVEALNRVEKVLQQLQ